MNAVIFGANGQDGYYLSKLLTDNNVEVIGVSRNGPWVKGDVTNYGFVKDIIKTNKPTYIFHLAAYSSTQHQYVFENHKTICDGTLYILESVKLFSPQSKVFLSGSAMQFKNVGLPIDENTPFEASSVYSVARIQSVYAARYYMSLGLKVYVGYFFNHDSPHRTENHMSKKITSFVQKINNGENETLEIGNVHVQKEWTFAGDVAQAIYTLVKQDDIFECVIGSGKPYSIAFWLELCFSIIGKKWQDYIKENKNYSSEYNTLVSNPTLLFSIGWQQKHTIEDLAKMMLKS